MLKLKANTHVFSLQPAVRTRAMVKQLGSECQDMQGLQLNTQKVDSGVLMCETPRDLMVDDRIAVAQHPCQVESIYVLEENTRKCLFHEGGRAWTQDVSILEEDINNKVVDGVRLLEDSVQDIQGMEQDTQKTQLEHNANEIPCDVTDSTTRGDQMNIQLDVDEDYDKVSKAEALGMDLESPQNLAGKEVPLCSCSREAILKMVKSKGPNNGKSFWVCSNSRPFYVKKKKHKADVIGQSCKFFRWVDPPLLKSEAQKKEEKQKKREHFKERELALLA